MGIEIAKKVSSVEQKICNLASMTDIQSSARGLESFRDHGINFRGGIPAKTGAETGLFETQEAWEEVIMKPNQHSIAMGMHWGFFERIVACI